MKQVIMMELFFQWNTGLTFSYKLLSDNCNANLRSQIPRKDSSNPTTEYLVFHSNVYNFKLAKLGGDLRKLIKTSMGGVTLNKEIFFIQVKDGGFAFIHSMRYRISAKWQTLNIFPDEILILWWKYTFQRLLESGETFELIGLLSYKI
jgi:hypothetical protein